MVKVGVTQSRRVDESLTKNGLALALQHSYPLLHNS
jgi:hypothetical protein